MSATPEQITCKLVGHLVREHSFPLRCERCGFEFSLVAGWNYQYQYPPSHPVPPTPPPGIVYYPPQTTDPPFTIISITYTNNTVGVL